MAIKQPALLLERERRKKKESIKTTPTVNKPTKEVIKNKKGTTQINRATISTKPSAQNTTQNRVVTNKERLTSKPSINTTNIDTRTIKTNNKPKRSIQTVDVYERGGKYYYKDGKKEKQVDTQFVQNALKNNRQGVIGRYDSKGQLRRTDSSGNVKEQSLLDKASYLARTAKTRAKKGTISIADAVLQETQNDFKKGENLKTVGNKIAKFASAIFNSNPEQGIRTAVSKAIANSGRIWKDKDKNILQKYVGSVLEGSQAIGTGQMQGLKDIRELAGSYDKNLDEKVAKVQKKLDEPVNKELEQLELEKYNYGKGMRRAADIVGTTANMAPGIATSIITRNPELGILPMALSAKGQTTERALQQGADLDTAIKMGTTSGLIEGGTEQLSGLGLGIFGKGTIDDIVSNAINSKIRNKGINFIAKQGFGLAGEINEELISDLAGLMIDKGTIDPNATYTFEDFLETVKNTFGSTILMNLLTGGYGSGAYNSNINDMNNFNIQQQQANEVAQRVESGEIDAQEGNALLEQVKDGTYQQNRNLEQIATQESQRLKQAAQQGIISQEQYTQGLQTLTNTVNQTREEINTPQQDPYEEMRNRLREENQSTQESASNNEQKQKQLEIIQKTNPRDESLGNHTWVNNVNDIKTLEETLQDEDYTDSNEFTPDLTKQDIQNAIEKGTITVYSSYPIEQGTFVTPSKMEAQSYAGNEQVYSQEVPIQDVAWLDPLQGQYAKVDNNVETNQKESTQDSTINNETKVKQVENKSDLKEVVDEDLYNVDIKDVENQIYRENYKLNEDVDDEDGPVGNYWDIDDTYFNLKDGNTLWIETPTEYGKLKNGKTNYNDEIHNKITMFIEDSNGKIIDEYNLANEKGEFSREDILNGIKKLTYDDSNKQPEGQIDMFGNVHVGKISNKVETNQNENTPATKSENVISEEIKPQKQETQNETVNQNKETQQETTETQQQESKGPEILDAMPKDKTSKWEKFKKGFNRLRHHFTDHREAWYDASRKFKNPALNSRADAVDVARDKAMVDIGRAQVDYNSKRYNNFVDENGNKVSMSFEKAYDIYNKIPVKVKNEYLVHWLNVDRLNQGVDQFGIPLQESLQKIQELENEYKDIGKWSENIYQYYRNLRQKLVDSGRITQEKADEWNKTTPHYVHIQRQVDNQSGNGVSTKGGKVDSSNLIQHVKGSTKPILPIKQTTSDFTIKAMNAIQLNNLAKEWAKTAGVGSTSNNIEDINDMDDIFGIDEKVFSDNGNGNYSIVAYDKGAVVDIPITKEMYEGLKPRDLRNLPTSKVTKIQRDLITNKNPIFGLIGNPIKDLQAMHFYSKFSAPKTTKTYTKLFSGRTIGKAFESNPNKVTTQDWVNLYYDAGNAANSPYNNGEFTSEKEASKGKIRKGLSKAGDFIEKGNNFMESMPRITEFVNTIESEGYTINKGDGPTLVPMKGKNPTKSVEQVLMEASYNAAEITVNFKRGGTWAKNFDKNFAPYSSPALQGASKFTRNITEAIGDAKQGDFRAATRVISRAVAMGLAPAILNGIIYGDDDDYEELQDYQKDRYYLLKGEWFGSKEKWIRIPRGREISTIQTLARRTGDAAKGKEKAYKGYGKFAIDQVGPVNPIDSNIFAPIAGAYVFNRSWSGNKIVPDSLKDADAKNQYNEKTDELSKAIGKKFNISPMKLNYVLDQYSGVLGDVGLPYITPRANNNTNNPLAAIIKDKYTFDQANSSKNVSDFYDFKRELKKSDKEEDKLKGQLMGTKAKELFALTNKKQEIQMDSNLSKKEKYEQALEIQKEINKYAKEITKEVKDADVNIEKNSATVGNHVYHKNKDGEWAAESEKTTKNREKLGLSPEEYYYYKNEESYTPPGGEKSTSITSGKYAKQNIAIVDAFNFDPSDYLEYKYKLSKIRGDKDSRGRTIRYSARNKKIKYLNSLPISAVEKAYLMKQNDKYYRSSDSSLKKAISNSNLSNKEKKEIYSYLKLGR